MSLIVAMAVILLDPLVWVAGAIPGVFVKGWRPALFWGAIAGLVLFLGIASVSRRMGEIGPGTLFLVAIVADVALIAVAVFYAADWIRNSRRKTDDAAD